MPFLSQNIRNEKSPPIPSNATAALREILEVHGQSDPLQRIAMHWIGKSMQVDGWQPEDGIARAVFAAIEPFIEASRFRLHGSMSDDGAPPRFETQWAGDKTIKMPVNAIWFLEAEDGQRLILAAEKEHIWRRMGIIASEPAAWLDRLRNFARDHNYMRGRVVDLQGEVIPLDEIGLDDIILTSDQRRLINRHVLMFPALLANRVRVGGRAQRGVLLVGPPGTGKSRLLRAIARQMTPMTVLFATPGQLSNGTLGGMSDLIPMLAPCAIFLEEIDVFGRDRSAMHSPMLADLLQIMDGLRSTSGTLWVATTNRLEHVEEALLRPGRFDRKVEFDVLPDVERHRLIAYFTRPTRISREALDFLHCQTSNLTGAQIRDICDTMRLIALERDVDVGEYDMDLVEASLEDCQFRRRRAIGFAAAADVPSLLNNAGHDIPF